MSWSIVLGSGFWPTDMYSPSTGGKAGRQDERTLAGWEWRPEASPVGAGAGANVIKRLTTALTHSHTPHPASCILSDYTRGIRAVQRSSGERPTPGLKPKPELMRDASKNRSHPPHNADDNHPSSGTLFYSVVIHVSLIISLEAFLPFQFVNLIFKYSMTFRLSTAVIIVPFYSRLKGD